MTARLLDSVDRSTKLAGFNRIALLLFRLDERQFFGINVLKVQEVLRCPNLTPMPSSHPHVRGVADIRGTVVPIIDLRLALGRPADHQAQHVVITEFNRSVQGFLVRAVERIVHIDVANLLPPLRGSDDGYMTAMTRWNDEIIEVVDVERVLAELLGPPPELSLGRYALVPVPKSLRVLVADDSRVARAQIERVLGRLGIEAVMVNDGRQALNYLRGLAAGDGDINDKLLMMISDIEMPEMDGYRLVTEIRQDPRLKSLYVLMHSSLSGVFNSSMVSKVGADRFISKFSSEELADGILERAHSLLATS